MRKSIPILAALAILGAVSLISFHIANRNISIPGVVSDAAVDASAEEQGWSVGQVETRRPAHTSPSSWRPPEVFAQTASPTPLHVFPRGENATRRYHKTVSRDIDSKNSSTIPAVLARSPENGRFHLLPEEIDAHTLMAARMVFDPTSLDRIIDGTTSRLLAPTLTDEVLTLEFQKIKTRSAHTHTLQGHVVGEETTSVVQIVYHDGILHGTVMRYDINQELEYRILADGHMMVRQLDHSTMTAGCSTCTDGIMADAVDLEQEVFPDAPVFPDSSADGPPISHDSPGWRTMDVTVGYTVEARQADGGNSQIEARIIASVDRMTLAFANSAIANTELVLLGTIEDPDYVENTSSRVFDAHTKLRNETDGYLDVVSDFHHQLGSDLASIIVSSVQTGGVAGVATSGSWSSANARSQMTASQMTFEHELGHNLGCAHAWGDTSEGNTVSNMGWRFQGASGTKYSTIMAYTAGWGGRVPYYSNPNVLHPDGNVPTGCVDGYDATNDPTVDPVLKPGYDGSVPTRGANNASTIDTGDGNASYGATAASNRATRTGFELHAPAAAAQWERGTTQTISFSGGDMDDLATIKLYKGGVLHTTLASGVNAATHRNFAWEIPFSLTDGSDYMIRVELDRNGSTLLADSGIFTIFSDPPYVTTTQAPKVPAMVGQISQLVFTFNVPMDPSTFSAGSDILSFTDPIGTSVMPSITGTSWSAGNTVLTVNFTPSAQPGTYQMVLSPNIADTVGTLLDQDGDGATGESVDDRVVAEFTVKPPLIRYDNMDTNPGWTFSANNPVNGWAWGQPTGGTGYDSYGINDPNSGYNGANVIGYNLTGDYERGITATRWATTPAMDCSNYDNVRLRFQRWLGIYYGSTVYGGSTGDNAYIEVSNNGTTWTPVWHNTNSRLTNAAWAEVEYDISAVADGQSTVYVRWGMGRTNSSLNDDSCGWNIDEVIVAGDLTDTLSVSPGGGLVSSGIAGGLFSPSSIQYTLENTGQSTMQWTASKTANWVSLSADAGTLASGASTTVTVSINSNAEEFEAGDYSDLVTFTNVTTGLGNATRSVNLDVLGPGKLEITSAGDYTPSGPVGGPFTPSSFQYTLRNVGATTISWSASKTANWLSLDITGGTLDMGQSVIVTASIHDNNANSLAIGNYGDVITFINTTNSEGNDTRTVLLTVNPTPATVTLGNLNPVYDGNPKQVSVITNPPGLSHTVTYNGSATAPTSAGTYAVVATITDPNYSGSASANLVIGKASQTITFGPLGSVPLSGTPIALTATASSGLPVSYSSSNTTVATISGSNLTTIATGTSTITATQSGNTNYNAATSVQQTITVSLVDPVAAPGGPYKVFISGPPLSLNGLASQPSNGATIASYSWDLNDDNTFGDVIGATPTAISYSDLVQLWSMEPGLNTIRLQVTDSAGKTATASTTVELIDGLTWDANAAGSGQTDGGAAWLNANQWWDGVANTTWSSGFGATFGNGGNGGNVTLASPTSVKSLAFNSFSGTYNLGTSGQTLTIAQGITMSSDSGAVTLTSPITLSGNQTWTNNATNGALQLLVNGAVNNNGFTLTIDGSSVAPTRDTANVRIAGTQSGAGGLIKNGPGVLWIQAASSHGGPTTVNGGILRNQVNSLTGLPGGNITLNDGVLEAYWSDTFTRELGSGANQIQLTGGASGFSQHASNTLNVKLGNTNTPIQWGSAFFNPTKLVLQETTGNSNALTDFQNYLDLNGGNRTVEVNGNPVVNARAQISGIISNITGTAGLIKTGNGLLTLTANNTYNGNTTVNAGTLRINVANTSNQSSTVSIASGATLHLGFSGTDTVDKLIVGGTQLAAGVYKAPGSAASGTELAQLAGTGTLTVTSNPPPPGPGPVDHFVISSIASPQTVGTAITGITITARDAANQTATSFTGTVTFGGTAGITGTSANFVDGVLSGVSVTPAVAGTDLTFTVNDGAGHSGFASITVQSIYTKWSNGPFAGDLTDTDPSLDFDDGSLATGIERVVGGDPTSGSDDVVLAPTIDRTTDPDGKLLFIFRRAAAVNNDANTSITVQYGNTLGTWTNAAHQGTAANQITITEETNGFGAGIDRVTVALPSSLAPAGRHFVRLNVVVAAE